MILGIGMDRLLGTCKGRVDMRFRCFGSAPCFLVQVVFALILGAFAFRLWNLIVMLPIGSYWNLASKAQYRVSVKRKRIDIHLLKLYQNAAGMLPNKFFNVNWILRFIMVLDVRFIHCRHLPSKVSESWPPTEVR